MKKIIFGIFAHPDDEAFGGPCGALLKDVADGAELHLFTFTAGAGEAATNPDNLADLGATRIEEWKRAGQLIGAKKMHFLGYNDGELGNQTMINATAHIASIIRDVLADAPHDATVEFMSMDLNGVTGHIDHIVAARTAAMVFYQLKATDSRISRLRLACYPRESFPTVNTDWIFMEPGRTAEQIDETIDARDLRDQITEVVRTHHTQRNDGEGYLRWQGDDLGLCHFIVLE